MINYEKTNWRNGSGAPINATNLNKIEQGVKDACDGANILNARVDILNETVDSLQTEAGSLQMEVESLRGQLDNYIVVERVDLQTTSTSVSSGSDKTYTKDISKTGYTPLGIVGFSVSNYNLYFCFCEITGTTLNVGLFNRASSSMTFSTCFVYVLYIKN